MFGSYARDEAGPRSDVDVLIVLDACAEPVERRGLEWDLTGLPVPADALVYTRREIESLRADGRRFAEVIANETDWVFEREEG